MRVVLACVIGLLAAGAMAVENEPRVPKDSFVPDSETAIRIAEAVWIPIYGEKRIAEEKPLGAVLKGSFWLVSGTLPRVPSETQPSPKSPTRTEEPSE